MQASCSLSSYLVLVREKEKGVLLDEKIGHKITIISVQDKSLLMPSPGHRSPSGLRVGPIPFTRPILGLFCLSVQALDSRGQPIGCFNDHRYEKYRNNPQIALHSKCGDLGSVNIVGVFTLWALGKCLPRINHRLSLQCCHVLGRLLLAEGPRDPPHSFFSISWPQSEIISISKRNQTRSLAI